jgi:hypothetical protein
MSGYFPGLYHCSGGYSLSCYYGVPVLVQVGFVVDKMAQGQVFPEYFGFALSVTFHHFSIWIHSSITDAVTY